MSKKIYILKKKKIDEMNTKELVLELFKKNPNKVYKNQEEIAKAISDDFKKNRKQAAISKALSKIGGSVIKLNGSYVHIIKVEGGYKLYKKGDIKDEIIQQFADKKVFIDHNTFVISKSIVAYTIQPKHHKYVEENMRKYFDEGSFFDIISHGEKMYFLLNAKEGLYQEIVYLPSTVKAMEDDTDEQSTFSKEIIEK